jgi:GTPase
MPLPVVAIVGRPNVGKSTLFNRVVGSRRAMVHDRPGVTRDRLFEEAELIVRRVLLVDTGGLEPDPDTALLVAMRRQAMLAIEEAQAIVFVVDGRLGLMGPDRDVAEILRKSDTPVLLAVNKIDGAQHDDLVVDFYELGLQPMFEISAEHGRGVYELLEAVQEALPEEVPEVSPEEDGGPIRIAVLGRPNIGKSTLVNQLLGEERHVVHDAPGTTMDPIDSPVTHGDRDYVLVDTAGVRRKSKIEDVLERWVALRAIKAIERCHVSLLMIDATVGPTEQDARLAELVCNRGRALIVLINKWDLTRDLEQVNARSIEDDLARRLPHATWAPHLFISAKTGKGTGRIFGLVNDVYAAFDTHVTTNKLNQFLTHALDSHSPPQRYHRPVRIYYMTQARVRPPTFVFWSNTPDGIGVAYKRYLANRLRDSFGFEGTPLKLQFRRRRKLGDHEEED